MSFGQQILCLCFLNLLKAQPSRYVLYLAAGFSSDILCCAVLCSALLCPHSAFMCFLFVRTNSDHFLIQR